MAYVILSVAPALQSQGTYVDVELHVFSHALNWLKTKMHVESRCVTIELTMAWICD